MVDRPRRSMKLILGAELRVDDVNPSFQSILMLLTGRGPLTGVGKCQWDDEWKRREGEHCEWTF